MPPVPNTWSPRIAANPERSSEPQDVARQNTLRSSAYPSTNFPPLRPEKKEQPAPTIQSDPNARPASVEFSGNRETTWNNTTQQIAPVACYWEPIAGGSMSLDGKTKSIQVDLESLILAALQHSPRVHAINDNTAIRRTAILEAQAEFDTRAFMESKMNRRSDPTGNSLDAGVGISRLRENDWFYKAGVRRKNSMGGKFEVSQQIGLRDSNSLFFTPNNQGNARLTLNYTQPLLNGFGRAYNRSLIVLAKIDTRVAEAQTLSELQDYLLDVTGAHWQLYRSRVALAQKSTQIVRAMKIVADLRAREDLDVRKGHIDRANGVLYWLEKERQRALGKIRSNEARLRALVNSPDLTTDRTIEIIPKINPNLDKIDINPKDAMVTALKNRPEIDEAMQEIQAASTRLKMAKAELMPVLDLVLETYVAGLDGDLGIGTAYIDQFRRGEPGYTAGLIFEVPLGNRAARARHERRKLELRQLSSQLEHATALIQAEIEVVVGDVNMAHREIVNLTKAIGETQAEIRFVQDRMKSNVDDVKQPISSYLEHLLEANERLATLESDFADAQLNYSMSLARLKRATGTLLQYDDSASVGATIIERTDGQPTLVEEAGVEGSANAFETTIEELPSNIIEVPATVQP